MHTYECIKGVLHGNAKRDLLWKKFSFCLARNINDREGQK